MKEEDHDKEQKKSLIDQINEQEKSDTREWMDEIEVRTDIRRERTTLWKLRRDKELYAVMDGPYLKYRASSVYAYRRKRAGGSQQ